MAADNSYTFKNPCVLIINNFTPKEAGLMDDLVTRLKQFFQQELGFKHGNLAKKKIRFVRENLGVALL